MTRDGEEKEEVTQRQHREDSTWHNGHMGKASTHVMQGRDEKSPLDQNVYTCTYAHVVLSAHMKKQHWCRRHCVILTVVVPILVRTVFSYLISAWPTGSFSLQQWHRNSGRWGIVCEWLSA